LFPYNEKASFTLVYYEKYARKLLTLKEVFRILDGLEDKHSELNDDKTSLI
jgi:hypothetical protein